MSELKAHKAYNRWIDEEMPTPNDDLICNEVYLKSEADKVIAEKDEKIEELEEHIDELQKTTDSAWSKVNAMYDELRHHKYKRCLAMAMWCRTGWRMSVTRYEKKEAVYFYKWCDIWGALADKFKEAK